MPLAEINGQRIRFEDSGGDGPAVVLTHGFLMGREMFAPAGRGGGSQEGFLPLRAGLLAPERQTIGS